MKTKEVKKLTQDQLFSELEKNTLAHSKKFKDIDEKIVKLDNFIKEIRNLISTDPNAAH